jgi:site-specific recombinase XerC
MRMFMWMLRCGLRVQEIADLTVEAIDLPRKPIFVAKGKGGKDRIVYGREDARSAFLAYLSKRSAKGKSLFLVQKGTMKGQPLSVRGIQKRMEYYPRSPTDVGSGKFHFFGRLRKVFPSPSKSQNQTRSVGA